MDETFSRNAGTLVTLGVRVQPNGPSSEPHATGALLSGAGIEGVHVLPFGTNLLPLYQRQDGFEAWNFTATSLPVAVSCGVHTLLTHPASLLPETFQRMLLAIRSADFGKNIRIHTGIGFPRCVESLKILFRQMGIDPTEHTEAGFLLERFEKAERDGYIDFFVDTWTRNCIEWGLSLAASDGVHLMPELGADDRVIGALRDVRGLGKHWTGADVQLKTRDRLIEGEQRFYTLNNPVPIRYLPGMLESAQKKNYSEEFLPLLEPTYTVLSELQTKYPTSLFWQNFSVSFIRMPQNNHAHTLPMEVITDGQDSFRELVIDVRYPGYKNDTELYIGLLRKTLEDAISRSDVNNHVYLGERGEKPFLDDVLQEGWREFSHMQAASRERDIGTTIARNSIVYERSARELYESLKNAPKRYEYAIAELGVYDANGMPEMLRHLKMLIERDSENSDALFARLKKTVFVCVDFAQDGLDSCKGVLDGVPELTGMFQEFKYIEGDITKEECHTQLAKWSGEFLFMRAIVTLDAFPEPNYVVRDREPYRVEYDTLIDTLELEKMVTNLYVKDGDPSAKHLVYHVVGIPNTLTENAVTAEHIRQALSQAVAAEKDKKVDAFIATLMSQSSIPREAALLIWVRVLHILKKKKRFVRVADEGEREHALAVSGHHPDTLTPFTLSQGATDFMSHLGGFLDPTSGTAFFTNLVSSRSTQFSSSHNSSQGPSTPGITPGYPVQPEPVVIGFHTNGLGLHVVPHRDHPVVPPPDRLRLTVSMLVVKRTTR